MSHIIGRLALGLRTRARAPRRSHDVPPKQTVAPKVEATPAPPPAPPVPAESHTDPVAHMTENTHPEAPHKRSHHKAAHKTEKKRSHHKKK